MHWSTPDPHEKSNDFVQLWLVCTGRGTEIQARKRIMIRKNGSILLKKF